jgi:diaminohydroxyphosphoribosylaminopyrimidine deaminase/5-amino-6-(5-phosphoribosylamino)uracil reductase
VVHETPQHMVGQAFMARALDLGANGLGLAPPNPLVGAVLVRDGEVVGEGWHEGRGTPHAEVQALRAAGGAARGATLYTTLEPCSHFGRTPPCAPALVAAGVVRVVAGLRDPNPVVDGRGLGILRDAGIEVIEGVLAERCAELVEGFAKHARTGLPLITLKMAASLDGKVAASDGSSRWITGEGARADAHHLRARSGAVVVGAGTVLADDPALTVRLDGYRGRQPVRVVVDGSGRVPPTATVFTDRAAPTLVATTEDAPTKARRAWEGAGAEVAVFPPSHDHPECRVPLPALLAWLGKREVQDVLIEGGPTLAGRAVAAGVVDRVVLYLAPKLIGGSDAPGVLEGRGVPTIGEARGLRIRSVGQIGEDLKVVADVHGDH